MDLRRLLLSFFCFFIYGTALASNISFMNDAPAGQLSQADYDIMKNTAVKALNNAKDGTKVTWRNPKTNSFGYVIPSRTQKENNTVCRHLLIFNSAKGAQNKSSFKFCKVRGEWKVS